MADLEVSTRITPGDQGKDVAYTEIGGDTVITIYESLIEEGRVIVDITTDDPNTISVAVNDGYVFGDLADEPSVTSKAGLLRELVERDPEAFQRYSDAYRRSIDQHADEALAIVDNPHIDRTRP